MTTSVQVGAAPSVLLHPVATYPLRQLLLYFRQLGTLGFGGPLALVWRMFTLFAKAALLWRTKRVSKPVLVLGAAVVGLVAYPLVGW